ncbi:hypothetical protein P5800_28920, partial [Bacillus paranthracis]|nr:hypothetical protein [Bacillus paranthracis]
RLLDLLLRHLHCTFHFEKENEFTSLRVRIGNFQRNGSSLYVYEHMEAKKEAKKTKILFSTVDAFISVRGYTYQFY